MRNYVKKIVTAVLTLAIVMSVTVSEIPKTASAALWQSAYSTKGEVTVAAGQTFEATVTTKSYGSITWSTILKGLFGFTITLCDSEGKQVASYQIADSDASWVLENQNGTLVYRRVDSFKGCKAGTYTIRVKFDADSDVPATFSAKTLDTSDSMPVLEDQELTAGFKTTLTVKDDTIKSCASDNKRVASVNAKGVVTGKKKGTAGITVTTEKGLTLTCKITVKANACSDKKITKKDVITGGYSIKPYHAKYDAKGNLVVKAMAINTAPRKITVKAWVDCFKNAARKNKMLKITLPVNSAKSITLKFPKSSLRKEKSNLPVSGIKLFYM